MIHILLINNYIYRVIIICISNKIKQMKYNFQLRRDINCIFFYLNTYNLYITIYIYNIYVQIYYYVYNELSRKKRKK